MVANKNQDSGSEFQIQNEDFPALPGTSQSDSSLQQDSSKSLGKAFFAKRMMGLHKAAWSNL